MYCSRWNHCANVIETEEKFPIQFFLKSKHVNWSNRADTGSLSHNYRNRKDVFFLIVFGKKLLGISISGRKGDIGRDRQTNKQQGRQSKRHRRIDQYIAGVQTIWNIQWIWEWLKHRKRNNNNKNNKRETDIVCEQTGRVRVNPMKRDPYNECMCIKVKKDWCLGAGGLIQSFSFEGVRWREWVTWQG